MSLFNETSVTKTPPLCCASWIPGDKPATPKGSSTTLWVTTRHKESGKLGVGRMTYLNGHVMRVSDDCDPPDCAVPHNPEEDGYCEEYEWTCWANGHCEHCETEWVWSSHYAEIIAHAFTTDPAPFTMRSGDPNKESFLKCLGTGLNGFFRFFRDYSPRSPIDQLEGVLYARCQACGADETSSVLSILRRMPQREDMKSKLDSVCPVCFGHPLDKAVQVEEERRTSEARLEFNE